MQTYLALLEHILHKGVSKEDRTQTGVLSAFGYQMRFDLQAGFPLLTTKKLHTKSIIHELLWFLDGDTNIRRLNEYGVNIWNDWADASGNLGPIYGKQWRAWVTPEGDIIDQMAHLVQELQSNPNSRRLVVSAWNVGELSKMALPPCHILFQFYVVNNTLSCQLYQRSADVFLGVPFNIASYALLVHMIAQQCGFEVGEFIWTGGDCHLYCNHVQQAREQLKRIPRALPKLKLVRKPASLFEYQFEDFLFIDYHPYPTIKAPIAV
jgi:thymidylate synthase